MLLYRNSLKVVLTLFFLSVFIFSSAQSPYELNLKKELIIFGAGAIGEVSGILIAKNVEPFTLSEIALFNANDINSFDRKATTYNSLSARRNSDILLYSSYAYPLLFLIDKRGRSGFKEIGVMGAEVILINGVLTTFAKITVKRTRPFVYNETVTDEKKTSRSARLSFYSGHTSSVAALSFFGAKVFSDYYPDSKWKPVVWAGAVVLPAATGYFRVKGGRHFWTDSMTGLVAGGLVGILIPHIHKKKDKNQKVTLSILSGSDSIGLTLNW